ncbi:MAG: efflux RND transporter permease subunit [Bacteroidales bacterium]|nr:efflux RND transporter permease subunit [Bacteroidales bacterium]MBR6161899.1 efflux RND transporter permease subunit [Bacteroidales bacterium]
MSLYQKSVARPIMTGLIYIAVIIIGIFSMTRLPVDLFPHMDGNTIMVLTVYGGASAEDIEDNVSKPIENVLNTLSDLKHITSNSKENYSIVYLEFEYGVDIDQKTNDVRDKLDMVKSALPDGANQPYLFKFSADDMPIMMLSVQSDQSTQALYKILDDKVASPLSRVSGVGAVSIAGAPQREIQVYCDPYKLESYNLTIETIASVLGAENRNVSLGIMDVGSKTYSMRVDGEFNSADEMEDIVVGSFNNKNIFLKDVAVVKDTLQERMQESYTDGQRGAMVIIQKQTGANTVKICKKVLEQLPDIKKTLPADVQLNVLVDNSDNITNTIDSLEETILIILLLVVIVVLFFLGRWRATLIIAIVVPVSLIAAFIYLLATGNTLNIISLSSISIAIGMVVDDSIVVLENITTHIERGSKPKAAAVFATSEVSLSIIASTLVIIAVFLPLTFLTGMAGVLFKSLGWIVTIVIAVSLAAAMSLTPMLCSLLLKKNPKKSKWFNAIYTPIENFLNRLDNWYAHLLRWCVNHRKTVVLIAFAVFGASLSLLTVIPTEFFPTQDNARLSVTVKLPQGTRVETTKALGDRIVEEIREKYPDEIKSINYSVGMPDEDNTWSLMRDNGTHLLSYNIRLVKKTERNKFITEIADGIRGILRQHIEIVSSTVTTGQGNMGGQSTVDIELYCYDFNTTDQFAADLAARMRNVEGCSEVVISRDEYTPELEVVFDRQKLAENGLNSTTAASYVRNRFNGYTASQFREDGDEYNIRVRYAPEFRDDVHAIENILMYNSRGQGIRVGDVGHVEETFTPPTIVRKDRERMVKVSCVVAKGAALSELVASAQHELDQMDIPPTLDYKIGGTWEDQQDAFGDMFTLMALIVMLVYVVMAAQFESFTYPFVIMFSIPFAFTGVFIGLAVTHTALGIMALIGAMMLIGIVVKNGIVLVDYTSLCRERGMSIKDSVVAGGRSRLRPILMTTLTTVLGMIPLAIDKGEGAEMWNSMGMVVAWGLTVSTLVTLILIPILYSKFAEWSEKGQARRRARRERNKALGVNEV